MAHSSVSVAVLHVNTNYLQFFILASVGGHLQLKKFIISRKDLFMVC